MTRPRPARRLGPVIGLALLPAACYPAPVDSIPSSAYGSFWYALNVLGGRGGYSQQTLRRVEHEGQTYVEATDRTRIQVKLGAQTLTASREEMRRYDADLRLVRLEHQSDQFGRKLRLTAEYSDGKLHVTREAPDGVTRRELDVPDNFGFDLTPLQALGEGALDADWTATFTTYDTELDNLDTVELAVGERLGEPEAGWKLSSRSGQLKVTSYSWMSDSGILLRQEVPEVMNLSMELVTEEEALREVSPLLLSGDVRVEQALGDPTDLTELRLRVTVATGSAADLFANTARQLIEPEDHQAVITVRAATAPTRTVRLPVDVDELRPFLTPSDTAQSDNPQIQAKAREIVGDETDAWSAVGRLRQWVNVSLRKVSSEPRPISASEVLAEMAGDCTEHSILMAALCQAVGIPVKLVAGLAYSGGAFHYHAWNEVWVGEWTEVDATWDEELVDAGHLQVAAGALDSTSLARLSLMAGRTLGSLHLEVLDHKTKP
ncbi:MAG: transglutaminase domain-containing protein [Armatimonadetes bacterium]|nr:transglutaminase domain-containing protein [Armatimonadota bacterium]